MIYCCSFPGISGSYQWSTTGITILDSTQISSVSYLFFDQNDTLYIADEYLNSVVWKLLRNAMTPILIAGQIQSVGSDPSRLNYPQGVYLDSKQNLYVSDYYNYRIQKYVNGSMTGATIAGITALAGNALNQFAGLRHFWLDPTETYMYITDCDNNRIMRYLTNSTTGDNGVIVAGGNAGGNVNTQLNYPWGIHYLPAISNYLYITNNYGHSVMKWLPGDSSGIFLAGTPGVAGSSGALLNNPTGIKIDTYLNMFVVDTGNNRVLMFCNNSQIGIKIAGTGQGGSSATELNGPRGIAFDSSMNMYISDHDNGRIQKFLKL
jgi:tripartite motif-containing protein 71